MAEGHTRGGNCTRRKRFQVLPETRHNGIFAGTFRRIEDRSVLAEFLQNLVAGAV